MEAPSGAAGRVPGAAMPLIPNRWTGPHVLEDVTDPDWCTEGVGTISILVGYHDDPGTGESFVIEQRRSLANHAGRVLREDVERWVYEMAGAAPTEYHRETWGSVYLPRSNPGRAFILLEVERCKFYPWTGFSSGQNLSRKRELAGWVVYDRKPSPAPLTADQVARLEERGYWPGGVGGLPLHRVIDSGRLWSDAVREAQVVETAEAPQVSIWVDPVWTEVEIVYSEPDKWTSYVIRKDHLRNGATELQGPNVIRREGYSYRLPVPIMPPVVRASAAGASGVRLEVEGGGAVITGSWGGDTTVPPDRYVVERRVVSEPEVDGGTDPWGVWDTDPAGEVEGGRLLFDVVDTTDLQGMSADPTPAPEDYADDEPGDITEPEVEDWEVVAELPNAGAWTEVGHAETTDGDVVALGEYEYRAMALIGDESSAPGPVDGVKTTGGTRAAGFLARTRRAADGSVEVDIVSPEGVLEEGYGETVVLELPVDLQELVDMTADEPYAELEELAVELATRLATRDQGEKTRATVEVGLPLLVLERGQEIVVGSVSWRTIGNGLQIESESTGEAWILDGFRLGASRSASGELQGVGTTLELVQP